MSKPRFAIVDLDENIVNKEIPNLESPESIQPHAPDDIIKINPKPKKAKITESTREQPTLSWYEYVSNSSICTSTVDLLLNTCYDVAPSLVAKAVPFLFIYLTTNYITPYLNQKRNENPAPVVKEAPIEPSPYSGLNFVRQ